MVNVVGCWKYLKRYFVSFFWSLSLLLFNYGLFCLVDFGFLSLVFIVKLRVMKIYKVMVVELV